MHIVGVTVSPYLFAPSFFFNFSSSALVRVGHPAVVKRFDVCRLTRILSNNFYWSLIFISYEGANILMCNDQSDDFKDYGESANLIYLSYIYSIFDALSKLIGMFYLQQRLARSDITFVRYKYLHNLVTLFGVLLPN